MNRLPRSIPVEANTRKGFFRMIANMVCSVLGLIVEKEHDHENKKGV